MENFGGKKNNPRQTMSEFFKWRKFLQNLLLSCFWHRTSFLWTLFCLSSYRTNDPNASFLFFFFNLHFITFHFSVFSEVQTEQNCLSLSLTRFLLLLFFFSLLAADFKSHLPLNSCYSGKKDGKGLGTTITSPKKYLFKCTFIKLRIKPLGITALKKWQKLNRCILPSTICRATAQVPTDSSATKDDIFAQPQFLFCTRYLVRGRFFCREPAKLRSRQGWT
jgi:hypothetical protein